MIYIIIFIIGCLLIMLYKQHKLVAIYKNNYLVTLEYLKEYDPSLKEYLEKRKNNEKVK